MENVTLSPEEHPKKAYRVSYVHVVNGEISTLVRNARIVATSAADAMVSLTDKCRPDEIVVQGCIVELDSQASLEMGVTQPLTRPQPLNQVPVAEGQKELRSGALQKFPREKDQDGPLQEDPGYDLSGMVKEFRERVREIVPQTSADRVTNIEALMDTVEEAVRAGAKHGLKDPVALGTEMDVKRNPLDPAFHSSMEDELGRASKPIPVQQILGAALPQPGPFSRPKDVKGTAPAAPVVRSEAETAALNAQIEAGRAKAEAASRKLSEAIQTEHGVRLDLAAKLAKAAQRALIAKHEHEDLNGEFDIQPRCERCDLDLALSALVLEWLLIAE